MNTLNDADVEAAARKHCDWLISSAAAQRCDSRQDVIDIVYVAFTLGACWALGLDQMIKQARDEAGAALGTRQ